MSDIRHTPLDTGNRDLWLAASLCPLLALSDTISTSIGLGAVVIITLLVSRLLALVAHRLLADEWQLAASTLVVVSTAAIVSMLMHAHSPALYQALGIFPFLIATNAAVIVHFQDNHAPLAACMGSAKLGLQIAILLLILGIARELIGRGSVFHDAGNQLGEWARGLQLFRADMGFLLAMLPPGAFIAAGLLLAARNWFVTRRPA